MPYWVCLVVALYAVLFISVGARREVDDQDGLASSHDEVLSLNKRGLKAHLSFLLPSPSSSPYPSPTPSVHSYPSQSLVRRETFSPFPSPRTCSSVLQNDLPDNRIVGGLNASNETASFMAAIHESQFDSFFSSAVVVAPRWLVTAAHCCSSNDFFVSFGGPDASTGFRVPVERVFAPSQTGHADWYYNRDICIVKLGTDAPKNVKFARVNSNPDLPSAGAYARAVGYGLIRDPRSTTEAWIPDSALRQVDTPIEEQQLCENFYSELEEINVDITPDMICSSSDGCGPCFGDSGGPLIQYDLNGQPVVIGIVSGGYRCADGNFPAIFARAHRFVDWMRGEGAEFTVSDDAQQMGVDGAVIAASPNLKGAGDGTVPMFALLAIGADSLIGLSILGLRFITKDTQDEEDAVDIPPL